MSAQNLTPTPPHRPRLLLISQYFPVESGGAEQQIYCLAQYLQSTMDVHYLTRADRGIESRDPGITISTIPHRKLLRRILGLCYALDYARVWKAFQRIHPDLIYVQDANAYLWIAARYARSAPCRLVWHIASARDVQRFQMRSLRTIPFDYLDKRLIEYGIRHADYIFGQAQYEEDLLRRNYGRTCDLIVGNWHPEPATPCTKGQPLKVLWVANIKPLKQPEVFIDLAERLAAVTGAEFLMVGRPGAMKYQRGLETRMRSVRGLTYLGAKSNEEVNRLLAEAHVFVNTSTYEGFPNTFVQAWLREVPVVSLQVDPDGLLARQGLGFLSGRFDQLVQDTRNLLENAELRTRLGARARAYALEHHSLTKNLSRVAEFFMRVAGGGPPGGRAPRATTGVLR
jgi:glycosyltransferase involved in cell wall biosynthesis